VTRSPALFGGRWPRALGALVVVLLALALGAETAVAHDGAAPAAAAAPIKTPPPGPHGRASVSAPGGASHVTLAPIDGAILGADLQVKNTGDAPLTLGRIAFLAGESGAPRSPLGGSATLAKGQSVPGTVNRG